MEDNKQHIDYFELIPKYLSGNASDAEVKLLEDWVLASGENKAQFNAFKKAWIVSGIGGNEQNIDVEREWDFVKEHLFEEKKVISLKTTSGRRIGLFLRIAAAALVLLAVSLWIFQAFNRDDFLEMVSRDQVEENQLPDGTEIALNQYSSIKYTPGKKDNYRRIELQGDAFFEVERDTARPFIVKTQNIEIKVLGTAFYVDARENISQVQVIVREGLVSVSSGSDKVVLKAGEIGIYDKNDSTLTKRVNEDVNYMAWKTGRLIFEQTSLEQVVFDLNRRFHSRVSIADEEIKSCPLDAVYEQKSLEAIVKIIESTFPIAAEFKEDRIIFSGKVCD